MVDGVGVVPRPSDRSGTGLPARVVVERLGRDDDPAARRAQHEERVAARGGGDARGRR